MEPFTHQSGERFNREGAELYYEVHGQGEPWLLLHGGFGSLEDFRSVLPLLKGCRCVALDSRGQGASTLGELPLTYERMERDAEALSERLELKDLNVMGFSDGGIVALRLARRLPLRRLVVIGAQHRLTQDPKKLKLLGAVTGATWKAKFPETYELYQKVNPRPQFDELAQAIVAMWLDSGATGHPGDVSAIRCPALIIRGDDDHLVDLEVAAQLKLELSSGHFLNIPFATHVAYLDQPEMFQIALDALRKTPGSSCR